MNRTLLLLLVFSTLPLARADASATETEVESRVGDVISVQTYPAKGTDLVLWLNGEWGFSPRQIPTAEGLASRGVEVWIPDLHAAWFLPTGRYSLVDVEPFILADLLKAAVDSTGKRVFVMAPGRAAALALTGIQSWRQDYPDSDRLGGAILFHPLLYRRTPQGGEAAQYLPIVRAANLSIYLLQPDQAATYWRVSDLVAALESGGSKVFLQHLPGVGNGFNIRPDFEPAEAALTAKLPQLLTNAIRLLSDVKTETTGQRFIKDVLATPERTAAGNLLRPHPRPGAAPALRLPDIAGKIHDIEHHQGQVTLVNFWATWCPPCVEEIPSLQRLQDQLEPRGLRVLTVAVGESAERVRRFVADHPVRFPVLLDTDGGAFKRWQAYAFPTTLVLDQRHTMRYAVFGAMAWDSAEVIERIEALLAPARP